MVDCKSWAGKVGTGAREVVVGTGPGAATGGVGAAHALNTIAVAIDIEAAIKKDGRYNDRLESGPVMVADDTIVD